MVKKATKKATRKVAKKVTKKATKKTAKKVAKKATKKAAPKAAKATKKVVKKAATKGAKKTAPKAATKSVAAAKLPALGSQAPQFSLVNQDGKTVSLSDFKGKFVVVYFYPRAMTPGCTVQACGLRDKKSDLAAHDIVVLGISPDKPAALKKFQARDHLNFDLLSDESNTVSKAYGSFGPKQFMGKKFDGILRQSFLLDKSGAILHIITKVDTKTHAEDILGFYSKLG
ncbi:MAG: thioredoxin-dependent thiol peroxidase [Bacteriovoracia bacterium]